jgi:tetratricopeptide (TPR) repeat protein
MKRFLIVSIVFAVAVTGVVASNSLFVHADNLMTEAHIQRIRSNCVEAQSTLYQLHASDALLRVNRGQLYESMSTKLMEPFDSRLTLNSYNAADLVATAASYDRQLSTFRTDYQQYEESMSKTLQINCTNQPVAFYDSVADTRTKRSKVHEDAMALHKTIGDYKDAFEAFAKNFKEPN